MSSMKVWLYQTVSVGRNSCTSLFDASEPGVKTGMSFWNKYDTQTQSKTRSNSDFILSPVSPNRAFCRVVSQTTRDQIGEGLQKECPVTDISTHVTGWIWLWIWMPTAVVLVVVFVSVLTPNWNQKTMEMNIWDYQRIKTFRFSWTRNISDTE